jgi:hypothetical protein
MPGEWRRRLVVASIVALFSLQIHSLVHDITDVGTLEAQGDCDVCAVARVAVTSVTDASAPALAPVLEVGPTIHHTSDAARSLLDAGRLPSPRGPPAN